ncbi:hypothetical protein PMALA_057010, partial [Plasmodium malariae]
MKDLRKSPKNDVFNVSCKLFNHSVSSIVFNILINAPISPHPPKSNMSDVDSNNITIKGNASRNPYFLRIIL